MIPLSDGIPARRTPYVNITLIVANFARPTGSKECGRLVADWVSGGYQHAFSQ